MTRETIKFIWSAALLLAALPTLAQESHTIRFRALTPEGAPVANAPIFWMPYKDELRTTFSEEHERSVTDADGYCTVDFSRHPDAAGSNFEVCVEPGDGHAGIIRVYPPQKTEDPTLITVEKQVPIRGRVRTVDGEPVVGAVMGSQWFPRTTTNDEGRFTLWGLGTGGSLSIFKEGLAWTTISSAKGEMDIVLQPGFPITFEAVDTDGNPLPAATIRYRDIAIKTGEDGRAISLPLPRDEDFYVQAWREGGAMYLSAEAQRVSVAGETNQVVKFVLKRQDETPTVSISGRVVMADTGEAVRARIFIHDNVREFDYYGSSRADTEDDGSFKILNLPQGEHFIQARPTKSTLYGSDGIVRVDCSNGSVERLELKVAPGCAVSGRLKMSDSSKPEPQWVMLRHGDSVRQSASERGLFQFFNLPPHPANAELSAGDDSMTITFGEPGTALRDVTLAMRATSDKARIRGQILNTRGEPQAGLSLSFRIDSGSGRPNSEHGETDGEGRFEIATVHAGTASVNSITAMRQFSVGGQTERHGFNCPIVEGPDSFTLEAGATVENSNYVVAPIEVVTVSGTINDEAGNPLEPRVRLMTTTRDSNSPRGQVRDGQFLFHTLPDEKFAMEFSLEKYQVRILEEGRDFERNDESITVVLPSTPYPDDVPLWTAITGAPWTQEAVNQAIQGESIRRSFDQYLRLLDPLASKKPAVRPAMPGSVALPSIPTRVVDASGNPVPRVTIHPAEFYGYMDPERAPEPIDAFPMSGTAATILSNADGLYDVPPGHLIWADGTCRQLTGTPLAEGEASPRTITLYQGRRLTVEVYDADGNPAPRISLAPYRGNLNPSSMSPIRPFPKTDNAGVFSYDGLPPARYTLVAHRNDGRTDSRLLQADLTGGEDVSVRVEYTPFAKNSGNALLEQLQTEWRSAQRENGAESFSSLWNAHPVDERNRMIEATAARLAQPVLSAIETLPFLADFAVAAEMKESVPDLMRQLPYLPSRLKHKGEPVVIYALAALSGNDAIETFTISAADSSLDPRRRLSMIIAMNRIGTPESLAAWRTLRDGARSLPNAPQAQAEYTHEERMVEAMRLVLGYVGGAMPEPPLPAGSPEVDADYLTGRVHIGNTEYHMRRYGDEWVPVEIGTTVME